MNIKDILKKAVSKTVDDIIDVELTEWPPSCVGVLSQPVRPKTIKEEIEE